MKGKKGSLSDRLYRLPHYAALARALRYDDHEFEDARKVALPLLEEYGAEAVKAAQQELVEFEHRVGCTIVRLKPEVKKLCFGLLGPAPDQEEWFYRHPDGTPMARPHRAKLSVQPEVPKKKARQRRIRKGQTTSESGQRARSVSTVSVSKLKPIVEDATAYVLWRLKREYFELREQYRRARGKARRELRMRLRKIRHDWELNRDAITIEG